MRTGDVIVIVGVVAALGLLSFAFLGGGMTGSGMMGGYGGGNQAMGSWWGIGMALFWVVLLAGLVGLIIWLFRSGSPARTGPTGSTSRAEDIMKDRYAKGELTREQYEQMGRDLRDD